MTNFRMQERDLDLFILEELHADTGFADWLANRVGLEGYDFETAEHSVSAKIDAKWGETDVLAYFLKGSERVAVLIEDKIAAGFQDRQAERYHERAQQIVSEGKASGYRTLLIAPRSYLDAVPRDETWQNRISIDDIAAWFSQRDNAHARWRQRALASCLRTVRSNISASNEDAKRFSHEFAEYLRNHHPEFVHRAKNGDTWGLTVSYEGKPTWVDIVWKVNQCLVDLSFGGRHKNKLNAYPEQVGLIRYSTDKTDMLRMPVGSAAWSIPLADQLDVVNEVVAACQRLRPIAIEVAAMPSVVEEAPQLP